VRPSAAVSDYAFDVRIILRQDAVDRGHKSLLDAAGDNDCDGASLNTVGSAGGASADPGQSRFPQGFGWRRP
jgi:hypothetical protein